jgi:sulfhydrogenase subunit alpha
MAAIEDDLRNFVTGRLHMLDEQLRWQCEQAIRNYDPCISCSTHFLDVGVRVLSEPWDAVAAWRTQGRG